MENDTITGGEELSIDEAAAAYAKVSSDAADTGQADDDTEVDSEHAEDDLQAADEDAGEEAEGETDEEGQADEEDTDEEPETERGRYVAHNGRVKLPDGSESTIAELIQGNLRDRDYRQKTMSHAEAVKAFAAQSEAFKASETQLNERAELVTALIQSIVGEEPTPADPSDPVAYLEYLGKKENRDRWIAHINALQAGRQQAEQARQAETQTQRSERAAKEWSLLTEKAPELKDEKRTKAFVADVTKHGEFYGFTLEEVREAVGLDHRQALVMKDAISWRKLQASKANVVKKVEGRPAVIKGGKRLTPSEQRARAGSDALSRLKQTGSEADAVAAYLASQKG